MEHPNNPIEQTSKTSIFSEDDEQFNALIRASPTPETIDKLLECAQSAISAAIDEAKPRRSYNRRTARMSANPNEKSIKLDANAAASTSFQLPWTTHPKGKLNLEISQPKKVIKMVYGSECLPTNDLKNTLEQNVGDGLNVKPSKDEILKFKISAGEKNGFDNPNGGDNLRVESSQAIAKDTERLHCDLLDKQVVLLDNDNTEAVKKGDTESSSIDFQWDF